MELLQLEHFLAVVDERSFTRAAEYVRRTQSAISQSIKRRSSEFHSYARWYYRTAGATANSYFNNQIAAPRPQLQRNIAGGSLGGRLILDRLFFFFDDQAGG